MGAVLLEKTTQWRCKVWALYALVFLLLVFYVAYPGFISFYDVSEPFGRATNDQELYTVHVPWWEADDCQCESQACGTPSMTSRSMFKGEAGGTCGHRAWAAGDSQRVLSFSLFGNNPEYWKGLDQILPAVEQLYPGWKVRLYTNTRGREAALCPLLHRYSSLLFLCDIISLPPPLGNLSNVHPMVWRMLPLGDPHVTIMAVRDTDSMVSEREVAAVQEWLASGKAFHVMRDHPYHTMPVMGGMWGARWDKNPAKTGNEMRSLRNKMISLATGKRNYGLDQKILQDVLWPAMVRRVMAHDSYNCRRFKGSSPWPTQRTNNRFVGAARLRKKYENSSIRKPCPKFCRPPAHRDWLYC